MDYLNQMIKKNPEKSASCESFNQILVSGEALRYNYSLMQKRAGRNVRLLAMVKADAYGHGMLQTASALSDAGCHDFGVAELGEAVSLRESGIKGNIFVFLGFDPSDTAAFFNYDLIPVIYDLESARVLSTEAIKQGKKILVHLKVDCGMTRLGVLPEDVEFVTGQIKQLPGIVLDGIASHFPQSDEPDSLITVEQYMYFEKLAAAAGQKRTLTKHIANSGGILYFPRTHCDMVRAGISLYGYYPDGAEGAARETAKHLRPAMTFRSRVLQLKTVPAGTGVSYGHTYITTGKTTLAVLPVGYEDGLSRILSNKGEVLVRGSRAKIRGRICMNLCMVDVTHIEGVEAGDEVVILGSQGDDSISADEIAAWMGSISYEVLCLLGNNNERQFR
jgi:alanine racemase